MYPEGYHFVVVTDHLALKWLNCIGSPSGRTARWALAMKPYSFKVRYRKGKVNYAGVLSRLIKEEANEAEIGEDDWIEEKLLAVGKDPATVPDYAIIGGRLYRHLTSWAANENVQPWKLCIP